MNSGSRETLNRGQRSAAKRFVANDAQEGPSKQTSNDSCTSAKLSQRELKVASQLLSVLTGLDEDRNRELSIILRRAAATDHRYKDREQLVERARQKFADRSLRSEFFNPVMFGEPAWDMLLALYVTEQSGARHTVTGLLSLSGGPHSTALRWLALLARDQLVTRRLHPTDKRVAYIELTDQGLRVLDAYFSATMAPAI